MEIPFTQYLRPHGRTRQVLIDRPEDVAKAATEMLKAGCRLEIEELMTGTVSITCERTIDEEVEVLAHELCPNGPEVPNAVDRLIREARSNIE